MRTTTGPEEGRVKVGNLLRTSAMGAGEAMPHADNWGGKG